MPDRPNLLILCSDQHNARVLGCYGDTVVRSRAIDRLAQEGVVFDAAYCNSPLCVPSRMSFLTGCYPHQIDALDNGSMLDSVIPTYAHRLGCAGYHTALIGRMHFIGPDQRHGFMERLVGDVGCYSLGGDRNYFAPLNRNLGNMSKPDPLRCVGAGHTYYLDYDIDVADQTCAWLERYQSRSYTTPFVLTAGFVNPHCPYIAPPDLYDYYYPRIDPPPLEAFPLHPFNQRHREQMDLEHIPVEHFKKAKAAYYGCVEWLDRCIGRILGTLDSLPIAQNTLVMYLSDHGEMMGEHGLWHKGCFYEDSIRVPWMMRLPLKAYAGTRVASPVSLLDLLPTLCELGDAPMAGPGSGRSLIPLIRGVGFGETPVVKSEYYEGSSSRMVRKGQWKLCLYGDEPRMELFDLSRDPHERRNLAAEAESQPVINELKPLLFDDGWHPNVLAERDRRLAVHQYWDVKAGFSRTVSVDPVLEALPDCWPGIQGACNYLSASAEECK